MQDRGGFLPSNNTHFTGTGPKEASTRHAERVSKQLSRAPGAGLTHERDRLLAGSGGRNLGSAFSGGNHDKSVSTHGRLRTQGWSSAPPATLDLLRGPEKSLAFTVPRPLAFTSALLLGCSTSFGIRTLRRGACLHLLFVMPIPVLPSSPEEEDLPARKPSLKAILGISWLCPPPLSGELQVSWRSSLGTLDNECVPCHVIELTTLERKRCGFCSHYKNKQTRTDIYYRPRLLNKCFLEL